MSMILAALIICSIICTAQTSKLPTGIDVKGFSKLPTLPGCPPDLAPISGSSFTWHWNGNPSPSSYFSFSLCGFLEAPCGESGQMCAMNYSNCTSFCQYWTEADSEAGASLGVYSGYKKNVTTGALQLIYTGGDYVNSPSPGPRVAYMYFVAGTKQPVAPYEFLYPNISNHEPNEPWIFELIVESTLISQNRCRAHSCSTCLENDGCSWCSSSHTCFRNGEFKCKLAYLNSTLCPPSRVIFSHN